MDEPIENADQGNTAPAATEPEKPVSFGVWLMLLPLALSAMMHGVDAMVVTVASPTISREMHAPLSQLLWVTTGYMLAYAALLVVAGKLGDRYGHRRVFLTGIVGFVISSVLVGLSRDMGMLIAWRVVQGACGASLVPSALAIVRLTFPPSRIKVAVGFFVGIFALSSAAGPFVGGVVVSFLGWRWVFFINVIVGAVTIGLTLLLIRPTPAPDANRPVDLPGVALVGVLLASLVLGVNQASVVGWTGALPLTCFVVAVVCAVAAVFRERSAAEPLLPPEMFRSRTFVSGNLLILLGGGIIFAIWFYLSLFLQNAQGASALRTGIELLPMPAAGIIAAPLGGGLNQKFGARVPLVLGVLIGLGSFFGLAQLSVTSGYGAVWPYLAMMGISSSLIVPVGIEAVISSVAERFAGVASGIGETMSGLGAALGVASIGTAITFLVQNGLLGRLSAAGVTGTTATQVGAGSGAIAQGAVPIPAGTDPSVAGSITRVAHDAFTSGFHTMLFAAMVVLIVLLPLIGLLKAPTPAPQAEDTPITEKALP